MGSKEKPAPKTARFDSVVESSGHPEAATLWTRPEDDRDFMRAVRENRIATLIQPNVGTKRDFGFVGFGKHKNASYLIFPKPIQYPAETKIVGIKYERLAATKPKGEVYKPARAKLPGIPMRKHRLARTEESRTTRRDKQPERPPTAAAKPTKTQPKQPKLRRFTATLTLTAVQTTTLSAEAPSASAARKQLHSQAAEISLDPAKARITRKLSSIR